jgi:hypothetical protein
VLFFVPVITARHISGAFASGVLKTLRNQFMSREEEHPRRDWALVIYSSSCEER